MTREEAIRILASSCIPGSKQTEALETLIPELRESEDERIRKWLCNYFSSIDKVWMHRDITCIDILQWLERQKEQKQAWSDEEYGKLFDIEHYLDGTLQLSPDRRIACIDFLKSLYAL